MKESKRSSLVMVLHSVTDMENYNTWFAQVYDVLNDPHRRIGGILSLVVCVSILYTMLLATCDDCRWHSVKDFDVSS